MTAQDVFRRITGALDGAGIAHMLTGSFASSYHGPPRATQDIDFVIEASPDRLRAFVAQLPPEEYYVDLAAALRALQKEGQFNVIDLATGWKIDLMIRRSRPFSKAEFGRRLAVELEGVQLFIATAEDVVVAKLEWAKRGGSERQIGDAAGILRVRGGELDRAHIETWVRELGLEAQWEAALAASEIAP